jgi:uroporphyrinogen III methyltransferase/synthase
MSQERAADSQAVPAPGKVILVGAGPGDTGLITVRGLEVLRAADVVVYDRLANPDLLVQCRKDAKLIHAGKGPGGMKQHEINALLVEQARAGHTVCRLKGGDPFLFGRGGEEASHLAANGIPYEIVPGVTSAMAVPAYAGIPVTDRRLASTVVMVAGHPAEDEPDKRLPWRELSGADTIVVLMGVANLRHIASELLQAGRDPDLPAAVIEQGTTSRQRTIVAPLSRIADEAEAAGVGSPAIFVVGRMVDLRRELAWVERRPLWGLRVLVTRPPGQADALSRLLRDAGAEPVEFPCIEVRPLPPDAKGLAAVESSHDWILFVSANAVSAAAAYLRAAGRDWRSLPAGEIAAVGPGTAAALEASGFTADFMPSRYTVAALAAELPGPLEGKRVLLPGRREVNPSLRDGLAQRGARLTVWPIYEIVTPQPTIALAELAQPPLDIITLTSSSAVKGFVELGGAAVAREALVACIGPPTAEMARQLGLEVVVVAEEHTVRGLVAAIIKHREGKTG